MIWTLSLAAKATLVLVAAMMAASALRRSSASARHAMLSLALLCLVALPALAAALPDLPLPLLSAPLPGPVHQLEAAPTELEGAGASLDVSTSLSARLSGWDWVILGWLAGVGLALTHLASGTLFVALTARRARPLTDPLWHTLLDEAKGALGVRRRVGLRVSDAVGVPNVSGYWSPVVLLPPGAASWPAGRRRAILLHELAHVARHDPLTQTLGYVVRAIYWPHPLVWWVVGSLRREAERACDDRVLQAGTPAPEYAEHLIEAARGRPASWLLTASAGAEGTHLGDRVVALLEDRNRRIPTRRTKAVLGGCALLALAILAAVHPVAAGGIAGREVPASVDPTPRLQIVHEPYGCLLEGRFPEIDATIGPAPQIAEARLYFTSAMVEEGLEYWIEMTGTGTHFVGRLPRPRVEGSPVRYRVEARGADGRTTRTERYVAVVAADASRCPADQRIAPVATSTEAVVVHTPAAEE